MPDPAAVPRKPVEKFKLLDCCQHFLGEVTNEAIKIYCPRCKQFFVLTAEHIKRHLT